jgi:hypothetical protein
MFGLFKKKVKVVDNRLLLQSWDIKEKILELKEMNYEELCAKYMNPQAISDRVSLIKDPTLSFIKVLKERGISYKEITKGAFEVKIKGTDIVIDYTTTMWNEKSEVSVNIFEDIRLNDYETSCIAYHLDDLISEEFGRKQVELRKSAEEKLKVVLMENLNDQL